MKGLTDSMKWSGRWAGPLVIVITLSGCATAPRPYVGKNPQNPQFERGRPFPPLDFFGDLISKLPQLLLWNSKYGNHRISPETEKKLAEFLEHYEMTMVKVRLNQWAPHKELARLAANKGIAWPYRIIFFPSTFIVSMIGRPFSGLIVSDYYDPGSNTINIFSDDTAIALHEAGHALDFYRQKYRGTYGLIRSLPAIDLFQEGIATSEAMYYLEQTRQYEELLRAYRVLYPAYATYAIAYISTSPPAYVGGLLVGHYVGWAASKEKAWQLETEWKWPMRGHQEKQERRIINQGEIK